jgi:tetratricopeptide (TPR) repeat protein
MYKILKNKVSVVFANLSLFVLAFISTSSTSAQTTKRIEDIARKTTVQINSNANPGGSGVIIKKEGIIYTVLTANHVVCDNLGRIKIRCRADLTYTVVTYDGKEYLMKSRQSLQTNVQDPDLAMVTFESRENYEIAPLGNSDNVSIQSDVLVAGFPTIFGRVGKQRTFTITNGKVVTFIPNSDRGYGLVYNATTFIGNSGGPVFDIYGRVIGIHGLADTDDGETNNNDQSETVNGVKPTQKTGFNAGIPINIFFSLSNFNRQLNPAVSINRQPNSTNPNNVSLNNRAIAYHDRGVNRYQSGDRQGAISDFTQAIQINPNFAQAYYNRGATRNDLGDKQGAINDFSHFINFHPRNGLAYFNRGIARHELGDKQGAISDFTQVIKLNSNNVAAYYNRGASRSDSGDKQGAINDFTTVINLNPNFAQAYNNRGLARHNLGDKQGAIGDFTQSLRINYRDPTAYNNRGIARHELGDKQGAISDFTQAIQISPNFANAYDNRGLARHNMGDKQGAISDFTRAIQINPNFAQAYNNRGATRNDLGDRQGAISDFTQAIQINPNFAQAYNNRGLARHNLGDKQGAISDFTQAIQINPNFAQAYNNRGATRNDLGDKEGAISDFKKAAQLFDLKNSRSRKIMRTP